jgi:hypothetical protein
MQWGLPCGMPGSRYPSDIGKPSPIGYMKTELLSDASGISLFPQGDCK